MLEFWNKGRITLGFFRWFYWEMVWDFLLTSKIGVFSHVDLKHVLYVLLDCDMMM